MASRPAYRIHKTIEPRLHPPLCAFLHLLLHPPALVTAISNCTSVCTSSYLLLVRAGAPPCFAQQHSSDERVHKGSQGGSVSATPVQEDTDCLPAVAAGGMDNGEILPAGLSLHCTLHSHLPAMQHKKEEQLCQ